MKFIFPAIAFCFSLLILRPMFSYADNEKWEYLSNHEGVALYQALEEREGLLPFMATADLDIPFQKIVMALLDIEKKHLWAPKLKFTIMHSEPTANQYEYSEYYTTPWPFEDRQFLLMGTVSYEHDRVVFSAVNSPNRSLVKEDHTLANVEILEFVITPLAKDRSRVKFTFSGDMGGWIPDFVKTIIQKKWPVRFIQALDSYIQKNPEMETSRYRTLVNGTKQT